MITGDEAREVLAALEEFKRALSCVAQEIMDDSGASMRGSDESKERHFAAIRNEAEVSRKLEAMKLPFDQTQPLFNLLTLPGEALDLLREHLGLHDRQN